MRRVCSLLAQAQAIDLKVTRSLPFFAETFDQLRLASFSAMCRKVKCKGCGKYTWSGCGQHVESSLRNVPEEQRCGGWRKGVCDVAPEKGKEGDCVVQ